jgi:hypothetical protein
MVEGNGGLRILRNSLDPSGKTGACWHHGRTGSASGPCADKPDLGSYDVRDGVIQAEVITERHNDDPHFKPLMGADVTAIKVRGRTEGSTILLEGRTDV